MVLTNKSSTNRKHSAHPSKIFKKKRKKQRCVLIEEKENPKRSHLKSSNLNYEEE
jgi:hypothetical protein